MFIILQVTAIFSSREKPEGPKVVRLLVNTKMLLAIFIEANFCVNVENKELKTRWHYDMLTLVYVE